MTENHLNRLRDRIDETNRKLLELLQERAALVLEVGKQKEQQGIAGHDPAREEAMLERLCSGAGPDSPFGSAQIREVFKAIFRASLELQQTQPRELLVRSKTLLRDGCVRVGPARVGGGSPVVFAGPCSVESEGQIRRVARALRSLPTVAVLRGGAYKPRSSPYAFQGLREAGLPLLAEAGREAGLPVVTEVLESDQIGLVSEYADMLQVGSRNMFNTELLRALGRQSKPVLLKRGLMATIEEFLLAAEYILNEGNTQVVLCERGIRTFERATRNTLDIAGVALLKAQTRLPVVVDLSHALGRRDLDLLIPCARAALAVGADGLMLEVHDRPDTALSDSQQQLDLESFRELLGALEVDLPLPAPKTTPPETRAPKKPAQPHARASSLR